MGLSEELDAMHAERKKAFELYVKLATNVPSQPSDIEKDLKKQKTDKDFNKARDKWINMLGNADHADADIDRAIDSWNDKIHGAMKARTELGKKIDATKEALDPIEEKIKSIQSSPAYDYLYKSTGANKIIEAAAADLKEQRKKLNASTEDYNDAGEDINSQKKAVGLMTAGAQDHNKRRMEANDILIKNPERGGKKSKAGKKR